MAFRHFICAIAILVLSTRVGPAHADLLYAGTYTAPDIERSSFYRMMLRRAGVSVGETLRGTEMTQVLARLAEDQSRFLQDLETLGETRGGEAYGFFLARFDHDDVRAELLDEPTLPPVFFVTRVQITLLLDVFSTRRAQSNQRRLESVYSAGSVTLLPAGGRYDFPCMTLEPPTRSVIAQCYEDALETAVEDLAKQVGSDKRGQRLRGSRVFQVSPVGLSQEAQDSLEAFGWDSGGSISDLIPFEIAYLVHRQVSAALAEGGRDDIAVLPPRVPWAVGPIEAQIRARLGQSPPSDVRSFRRFGVSLDVSVERAFMDTRIDRVRMPDGRERRWDTRIAKTRLHGVVTRRRDHQRRPQTLPRSMKERERVAQARAVRAFRVSPDVTGDALDLMAWWDSLERATTVLAPQLVDRMARVSDELD